MSEQMAEGLSLMFLGMGSVFVFLLVLVLAITLMSKLAHATDSRHAPASSAAPSDVPEEVVMALKIAVHKYRSGVAS